MRCFDDTSLGTLKNKFIPIFYDKNQFVGIHTDYDTNTLTIYQNSQLDVSDSILKQVRKIKKIKHWESNVVVVG